MAYFVNIINLKKATEQEAVAMKAEVLTLGRGPWFRSSCQACSCAAPTTWTQPWNRPA